VEVSILSISVKIYRRVPAAEKWPNKESKHGMRSFCSQNLVLFLNKRVDHLLELPRAEMLTLSTNGITVRVTNELMPSITRKSISFT
jgi:hypothetical protein